MPRAPDILLRIEAAAYGGKPVEFRMMLNAAGHMLTVDSGTPDLGGVLGLALWAIALLIVLGAVFFVRRNLHLGRGDRKGAAKLAALYLATATVGWTVREHHITSMGEVRLFLSFAGDTALVAGVVWLFYMALEPILRRRWPEALISWTRLLNGEWRDPLVGRDVLIGCTAALIGSGLGRLNALASGTPLLGDFGGIFGTNLFVVWLVDGLGWPVISSLGLMIAFFLVKRILHQDWLVAGLLSLVTGSIFMFAIRSWLALGYPLLIFLFLFLAVRFGLLVLTVGIYVIEKLDTIPMTFDTSTWYFRTGLAAILFMLVLSIAAFRISLGGAHLLKELED